MVLLPAIADAFAKNLAQYFPIFFVSPRTMVLLPAFGAAVGVLAAVAPAVRVGSVRIAEAFRRIG
jgi:putative ABC transport system permease protein